MRDGVISLSSSLSSTGVASSASPDRYAPRPRPGEAITDREPLAPERPGFAVDLRRCIGCHACSIACKTAHDVPLGEFPLRVRWLPQPNPESSGSDATFEFVPIFSESLCHDDEESLAAGLEPACVRACPTNALAFGDLATNNSSLAEAANNGDFKTLTGPNAKDLKVDVIYRGLALWVGEKMNQGAALDPRDEDPIYEQR